MLKYYIVFS